MQLIGRILEKMFIQQLTDYYPSPPFYSANIKNLNDDQECFLDGQVFVDSLQALLKIFPKSGTPIENVKIAFDNYVSCREKVGIFSLSKNPCVGMMWALYASMRHGYCIIYNKDALLKDLDQELVKQENKVESIDEINGPQIILGSLEEVTLTGNWPKKYGNNE